MNRTHAQLEAWATGASMKVGTQFDDLRHEFMSDRWLAHRAPDILKKSRSAKQFWSNVKSGRTTYSERRHYLLAEFCPLLDALEYGTAEPATPWEDGPLAKKIMVIATVVSALAAIVACAGQLDSADTKTIRNPAPAVVEATMSAPTAGVAAPLISAKASDLTSSSSKARARAGKKSP